MKPAPPSNTGLPPVSCPVPSARSTVKVKNTVPRTVRPTSRVQRKASETPRIPLRTHYPVSEPHSSSRTRETPTDFGLVPITANSKIRCTVCLHPKRAQIDEALLKTSYRVTSRRFGVSIATLCRHKGHIVGELEKLAMAEGLSLAGSLTEQLMSLAQTFGYIVSRCQYYKQWSVAIQAGVQIRETLELVHRWSEPRMPTTMTQVNVNTGESGSGLTGPRPGSLAARIEDMKKANPRWLERLLADDPERGPGPVTKGAASPAVSLGSAEVTGTSSEGPGIPAGVQDV